MNDSKEQMTKNVRNTIDNFGKLLSVLLGCDFDDEVASVVIFVLCVCLERLLCFLVVSESITHIGTPSS